MLTAEDHDQLKILSILHYVFAGLAALGGCGMVAYFAFIGTVFTSAASQTRGGPPPAIGGIFLGIGLVFAIFTWALAACIAYAGKFLSERRNYMFCLVVAAFICLQVPVGTLLGVFTIIVLVRPTVKAAFEGKTYTDAPRPPVEQDRFSDAPPPVPPTEDQGHYR